MVVIIFYSQILILCLKMGCCSILVEKENRICPSNVPNDMDFRLQHLISFEVDFEAIRAT